MGTHPIFESDFDCLTEEKMNGNNSNCTGPAVASQPIIAVIGGTGLENPEILQQREELATQETPWGEASTICTGLLGGVTRIFILSRHGKDHDKSPTQVNYNANLWALKKLGVTHVVATTANGSLREDYRPGDLVVLSDYIDWTKKRTYTHVGNAVKEGGPRGVMHLPSKPAFDEKMRELISASMDTTGVAHHKSGTIVVIEGPRFSTLAESKMFQTLGGHTIGMTTCPEAHIAKEMGLHYAAIAMVTDYDCWKENEEVNVASVMKQMKLNAEMTKKVLLDVIPRVTSYDWSEESEALARDCRMSHMV